MATNKKKTATRTSTRKGKHTTPKSGLKVVVQGRLLTLTFFKRNAWLILIVVGLVLALIGQRYSNHTKMQEIKELTKELDRATSEQLHQKSLYMSLVRENEMLKLLNERHIGLGYQEQPPYSLSREDGVKTQPKEINNTTQTAD